ncbi:MAG: putative Zn-dependent alcohol dehydrogenase [Pseudonocardiales bacterium]|nr:putative Zn-dependent alcohol dehydrogenase [Pseudonocardiales bacterium]
MKAWSFVAPNEPLHWVSLPDPEPGPGEVVVDVKAAGFCRFDLDVMDGGPTYQMLSGPPPIVLGHEIAGVISALGPDVTGCAIGDRVGMFALDVENCAGFSRDGGLAQKTIGQVGLLVPIPAGVTFAQAALATDAGMTAHHAVKTVGEVGPGTRVGVIGLGGLGAIGARMAVLLGAEVHAAEINIAIHDQLSELGIVNIVADADDFAGLDLDVVIDFAGFEKTTAAAIMAVRPGGLVVQVGIGRSAAILPTDVLVMRQVRLIGSIGGDFDDVAGTFALIAAGGLDPRIEHIEFDEVPDGIDRLRRGAVNGRLVAHIAD